MSFEYNLYSDDLPPGHDTGTGVATTADDTYDDSSVDAAIAATAANAADGFIPASGATSTPVAQAPSILKNMKTPLETAERGLEKLVLKLQWTNQITTYREFGNEFLSQYSTWYNECQSIESAEALGAYQPSACRVKSKFLQPIEHAKEGTAYQSLRARADAKCKEWSPERGAFHLEMRNINSDVRRLQLLEHATTLIWKMARILLASIKAMSYDPHNLVADMLLIAAHNQVLRELCDLEEFVSIYKRNHKCGRAAEDPDVMYVRRFGTADESDDNAPPQRLPTPLLFKRVRYKMSTKILPSINKHWQDKVAFLLALGLPESKNIQQIVGTCKELGQQLISQVGGISSAIASKLTTEIDPNINKGSTEKKNETKSTSPSKLIWNSYKKEYLFTRDETAVLSSFLSLPLLNTSSNKKYFSFSPSQ
eukprot:scaffold27192_cov50-Cyclotella_meneghiniana.AAC.1